MKLTIRSIGLKRAEATVIMANIAYNMGRPMAMVEGAECVRLMAKSQNSRQIDPHPAP